MQSYPSPESGACASPTALATRVLQAKLGSFVIWVTFADTGVSLPGDVTWASSGQYSES